MFVQVLSIAATSSAYYMLLALGFTLIFGLLRIVNFAHGEFVMIGAYSLFWLTTTIGLGYFVALPIAGVIAALAGLLAERLVFRRFVGNELGGMITAIALAITIQGAASLIFTVDQQSVARPVSGSFEVAGALLAKDQIFVAGAALVIVLLLHLLIQRTRLGLMMKAVAEDAEVARIYGVAPSFVLPVGFALGCLLAGLAGALVAPLYTIHPYMGEVAILKSFIVVVLGGLGSLRGAMIAAIFLGVTEALVALWASATLATLVAFALVMVILIARPAGIGGRS